MLSQAIFILTTLVVVFFTIKLYGQIIFNIRMGKPYIADGPAIWRWKQMILVALGQKKMFSNWIPAIFHLFIYLAFIITQIELIEIFADGLFGFHRFFAEMLGPFYTFIISTIEFLSVFAFIATFIFLYRRNIGRVGRFWKKEMKGWPFKDGNFILLGEILLILAIFSMNGADQILQGRLPQSYHEAGPFVISQFTAPWIFEPMNTPTLVFFERFGWWLHIAVVYGFILYLPYSKHLHLIFSFPNTYFTPRKVRGTMDNIPMITQEVSSMMGFSTPEASGSIANSDEIPEFGAADVHQLNWKNILDGYTCTECGRCTDACPPNQTGKELSPRKIVMMVRDRAEEVGKKIKTGEKKYIDPSKANGANGLTQANYNDGKNLFSYIKKEEIHACTSCNACVEACPVLIDPLDIILQMRRYEVLTEAQGPQDWIAMFTNLENSGSVWQMQDSRTDWIKS